MSNQNEERIGKLILWRNDLVGQGRKDYQKEELQIRHENDLEGWKPW